MVIFTNGRICEKTPTKQTQASLPQSMSAAAAIRRRKFSGRELSCSRKLPQNDGNADSPKKQQNHHFPWDMTDMGMLLP